MTGTTLADAEAQLTAWRQASLDVASRGQSYAIAGRSLTRADVRSILDMVAHWEKQVKLLSATSLRRRGPRYIVGE